MVNKKIKKKDLFNLYKEVSNLSDVRRAQGKRHKIELILMIVILAIMNGYDGYHATGDFIKRNKEELILTFNPKKNRLPSYSTIRRVLNNTDFDVSEIYCWSIDQQTKSAFCLRRQYISEHVQKRLAVSEAHTLPVY